MIHGRRLGRSEIIPLLVYEKPSRKAFCNDSRSDCWQPGRIGHSKPMQSLAVHYRGWVSIMLTPFHEGKGVCSLFSASEVREIKHFWDISIRCDQGKQCGAWLQINFSYFVIFTYMEKFLPQWWQVNIVSLNFDFHKEFSSNLMRNRIHFVFRSKTQEGNKKKNQYLVTEVLGSLLNETGRNLIKFYEPTLCLQIKKMSKGIKTVRHSLLKLLCNAPTYLLRVFHGNSNNSNDFDN